MTTSYAIYCILHKIGIPMDIRNVCVFLAPIFAGFTSLVAYLMTKVFFANIMQKYDFGSFLLRKLQKDQKLDFSRHCLLLFAHHICQDQLLARMIMKL